MTDIELAKKVVNDLDYQKILDKLNTWGETLTEEEKEELRKKGGVL